MPLPFAFTIQHAACGTGGYPPSPLDADTRHLVMVMALLSDKSTGKGTSSQSTIARAMGRSVRHVGNLVRALEANTASPVRITRKRRGAPTGRSSDEYELTLTGQAQRADSGSSAEKASHAGSDGHQKAQRAEQLAEPKGTPRHPKRHATTPEKAQPADDQHSDQHSDQQEEQTSLTLVFAYWAEKLWSRVHKQGTAQRTSKRERHIRARLAEGSTVKQLCAVVDKVAASDFHLNGGYIEPETIFRNREKVQWWLAKRAGTPRNSAPFVQHGGNIREADTSWIGPCDEKVG